MNPVRPYRGPKFEKRVEWAELRRLRLAKRRAPWRHEIDIEDVDMMERYITGIDDDDRRAREVS